MRFPLADWIDSHADCRYDLATSGMRGSVPRPTWPDRRPSEGIVEVLREEIARRTGVAPERLFLAHGAAEANAWVLGHLGRELGRGGRAPVLRVRYPEYPPLFEAGRAQGFRVEDHTTAADVAVVSRPRNPEGDLWSEETVARFAAGARHLLVDETFREFAEIPSIGKAGNPRLWATGSFTKFFGADEVRVGFVIAPPEAPARFGRYVGLVSDQLAPASAAAALRLLRHLPSVRHAVRAVVDRNLRAFTAAFPDVAPPVAPLYFDRLRRETGRRLAERCLAASVLVCPGAFFGEPRGVRVCLTRRNFPEALRAYLTVRERPRRGGSGREAGVKLLDRSPGRPTERPLGERDRRRGSGVRARRRFGPLP